MELYGSASFGWDIGHSSCKLAIALAGEGKSRKFDLFPTVVVPATHIDDEETARLAAKETVNVGGQDYFVGKTAVSQGHAVVFSGQDKNWIKTPAHDALLLAAWRKSLAQLSTPPKNIVIVLGLPMAYYATQKDDLKVRAYELLSPLLEKYQHLEIKTCSQSRAPLVNLQHLEDGSINPKYNIETDNYAVIDIGHFTTDFCLQMGPQIRSTAGDSIPGLTKVYSDVKAAFEKAGLSTHISCIDTAVCTGKIREFGVEKDVSEIVEQAAQSLRAMIIDRAQNLFGGEASQLNSVVVTGGGAPLIYEAVLKAFRNASQTKGSRYQVAEGLCRFGLFAVNNNPNMVQAITGELEHA